MSTVWNSHKQHPSDASLFSEEATLTYVAVAAGAFGQQSIKSFLIKNSEAISALNGSVKSCKILTDGHETVVVEESLVSMEHSFYNELVLPGVTVTNKHIEFPIVSIVTIKDNLIFEKRVYWDQATVLKQIQLIPSEVIKIQTKVKATIVPVLSRFQAVDRFMNERSNENANKLGAGISDEGKNYNSMKSLLSNEQPPRVPMNTQVKNLATPYGTDFNAPTTPFKPKFEHRKNQSSLPLGYEPSAAEISQAQSMIASTDSFVHEADSVRSRKHFPEKSTSHFNSGVVVSDDVVFGGKKRFDGKYHNQSHIEGMVSVTSKEGSLENDLYKNLERMNFEHQQSEMEKNVYVDNGVRNGRRSGLSSAGYSGVSGKESYNLWESSSGGSGIIQGRSSSRVLRPPGGGSTLTLG